VTTGAIKDIEVGFSSPKYHAAVRPCGFWILVCYAATQLAISSNAYKWCAVIGKPRSARPNQTALSQWTFDT